MLIATNRGLTCPQRMCNELYYYEPDYALNSYEKINRTEESYAIFMTIQQNAYNYRYGQYEGNLTTRGKCQFVHNLHMLYEI